MTGTVRDVIAQKAYGFILGEDKNEYFFHRTDFNGFWEDLVRDMNIDSLIKVDFKPEKTFKGFRARDVNRLDHPNQVAMELENDTK